jgi:endonuclease YncB( thermonuclease family)
MKLGEKLFVVVILLVLCYSIFMTTISPSFQRGCKGTAACFTGNITKVIDGDTVDVSGKRIRLSLVNAPEIGHEHFVEAKKLAEVLCPLGSPALVDEDDEQKRGIYGRLIGQVYCNYSPYNNKPTKNLNEQMVKSWFAVVLTNYCSRSEFANETWARGYGC